MIVKEPDITYGKKEWITGFTDYKPFTPLYIDDQDKSLHVRQLKFKIKVFPMLDERTKLVKSLRGKLSKLQAKKLISEIDQMRNEWERDF